MRLKHSLVLNTKNVLLNIFINKPAFYFSERLYIKYIIVVSMFKLKSYQVFTTKFDRFKIHQISFKKDKIFFTSGFRISRFLRGFNHAGKRVWNRYFIDDLLQGVTPRVIIDIGCNIGEFTYYAAQKFYNSVYIHSFDPDPVAGQCFKLNIINSDIKFYPFALSDKKSIDTLYLAPETADTSFHSISPMKEKILVMTETLDNLLGRIQLEKPALLKMDAEGNEPEVLLGGLEMLRQISFCSIDCGPERYGESTRRQVIEILVGQGFEIEDTLNKDIVLGRRRLKSN